MIHLVLGTKAQYIKTAPVIWRLQSCSVPFRLIDTGQHAGLSSGIRQEFKIREPEVMLRNGSDISLLRTGAAWLTRWILWGLRSPAHVRERLFADQPGICLVHGDTASAWLGAWLAQRAGLPVAHLEAGLRSFHALSPFPEEICRWQTSQRADLLFPPSSCAEENLKRMRLKGRIVPTGANTGLETVREMLRQGPSVVPPWPAFALALIHRMETLYSRRRLTFVARAILRAAEISPVLFLLHEPTRRAFRRTGLLRRLTRHPGIRCRPLVSPPTFLRLLEQAQFLLTDGGSIQEESFYLNVPCLLLRDRTERTEGLIPSGNVCLAQWRWETVERFLRGFQEYRRRLPLAEAAPGASAHRQALSEATPSRIVVEALQRAV